MATTSTNSVVAFFSSEAQATEAVSALKDAGFTSNQIGVAAGTGAPEADYASAGTAAPGAASSATSAGSSATTTAGATSRGGAQATAGAEGVWGKLKNFFEGGENTQGGVEQYADERTHDRASHEITNSTSGYGYETGDVSGSLGAMSVPQEHARYFEHRFSTAERGVLVTVTAPGRESEAADILEQQGGDLGTAAASYDYSAAPAAAATGQQNIQLLGEILRIHKDRVSRGEVRIRKEIITEQQTVQVPVTHEELVIERVPVSGQTSVAGTIGESQEIRIPLSQEIASADKQTVVNEEISVGKRAVEEVQQVGGSVRHEELRVNDETTGATGGGTDGGKL